MRTSINTIIRLVEEIDPFPNSSKSHARFWKAIFNQIEESSKHKPSQSDFNTTFANVEETIELIKELILCEIERNKASQNNIESLSGFNARAEDIKQKLNSIAMKDSILEIEYKKNLSPPQELEGGVGFNASLNVLSKDTGESVQFFQPCLFNNIDRILLGEAFLTPMLWLRLPSNPGPFEKQQAIDNIRRIQRRMKLKLREGSKSDFSPIYKATTAFKEILRQRKLLAIWPLVDSQLLYEEGVRFYEIENKRAKEPNSESSVSIFSASPGTICPDEFYGFDFYETSSKEGSFTKRFPPSLFTYSKMASWGLDVQRWESHVLGKFEDLIRNVNTEQQQKLLLQLANPFRVFYFINGIGGIHKNIKKNYFILGTKGLSIHEKWDRKLWKIDSQELIKFFAKTPKFEYRLIPDDVVMANSWMKFHTLVGTNIEIRSSRSPDTSVGQTSKIVHGFWWDWELLHKLVRNLGRGSVATGFTSLVGGLVAAEIQFGPAVSGFFLTQSIFSFLFTIASYVGGQRIPKPIEAKIWQYLAMSKSKPIKSRKALLSLIR